jgi:hypothetical protein
LVFAELLAHPGALGLEHAAVEIADHAFERLLDVVALAAVDEGERDRLAVGAVEDDAALLVGELVPRGLQVEAVVAGEAAQHLHVVGRGRLALGPGHDGALGEGKVVVGDHQILVELLPLAQAIAGRAGALRSVEGEQAGLDLGDGEAGHGAGELFGEADAAGRRVGGKDGAVRGLAERFRYAGLLGPDGLRRGVSRVKIGQPVGQLQRGFEAVGEAGLDAVADDDAVDHHFDVVLVLLVERGGVLDVVELAVDADAGEAGLLPLGQLLAILALAAADDGGEQVEARAFGQAIDAVDHLADGLGGDGQAGGRAVGHADAAQSRRI